MRYRGALRFMGGDCRAKGDWNAPRWRNRRMLRCIFHEPMTDSMAPTASRRAAWTWTRLILVMSVLLIMVVPVGADSGTTPLSATISHLANVAPSHTLPSRFTSDQASNPLNGLPTTHSQGADPYRSPSTTSPTRFLPSTASPFSNLSWVAVGPREIPNATGIAGLNASGKLQAFAVDPSNPLVMYAGGGSGPGNSGPSPSTGIYTTSDGGLSWTADDRGLGDFFVSTLWVDPAHPSTVLAGTWYQGIYWSNNSGGNWSLTYSTTHVTSFLEVNGTLYAATGPGILASSNVGLSWTLIESTSSPASSLAVCV